MYAKRSLLLDDDHWDKGRPDPLARPRNYIRGGRNAGLPAAESQAWLNRVVDYLVVERGIEIPILVRKRHELADLTFHRITDHGRKQIRKAAELTVCERRRTPAGNDVRSAVSSGRARLRARIVRYSTRGPVHLPETRLRFDWRNEGTKKASARRKLDDHPNVKRHGFATWSTKAPAGWGRPSLVARTVLSRFHRRTE